ncbi:Por secretion system C-terminal sorting domain-containing protein [Cyclobacterium xiamenense]|uniref:Por secretion system C-terminal sorting domain-containing protein n=1 Tax=Cyclobacterium xiamenense TaxID=1297121 RepID=A0A1H6Y584_9BACT|nr:putative Ig domain-containing protein [Cyclobacterium xiamenense]SEJ36429.1 Por secretion system C-terminal sorting domain-containing protein [Cyclobacterium xiamenense]
MRIKRTKFQIWQKTQRKYRNLQYRLSASTAAVANKRLNRKLIHLGNRLNNLNRKWKLGIATSLITCWLAFNPLKSSLAQNLPAELDLSTFVNGTNGIVIKSDEPKDGFGFSISSKGDFNGDGFNDLVVSAPLTQEIVTVDSQYDYRGKVSVIFGKDSFSGRELELSSLDESDGFSVDGINSFSVLGRRVDFIGDINSDGFDDIIMSSYDNREENNSLNSWDEGEAYVIFGTDQMMPSNFDLSTLDGSNGFRIVRRENTQDFALHLTGLGDVNGDGIDDFAVTARKETNNIDTSETYVVFGSNSGFPEAFEISSLDGLNGYIIVESAVNDSGSNMVEGVGDFNGDGINDILIGGYNFSMHHSFVVFGRSGYNENIDLLQLSSEKGYLVTTLTEGEIAQALQIAFAGDVNGDGMDDIVASNYDHDDITEWYMIFGREEAVSNNVIDLSNFTNADGFLIEAETDWDWTQTQSRSVAGNFDFNRDGFSDFLIGASENHTSLNGTSYMVFGSPERIPSPFSLSNLNGENGFKMTSSVDDSVLGFSLAGFGDFNGDGFDDVAVSLAAPYGESSVFILFGRESSSSLNRAPVVFSGVPDQTANVEVSFNLTIPSTAFEDADGDDLSYTATLEDGTALPSWLTFEGATRTFSGTPAGSDVGSISIKVTADDGNGGTAEDIFVLTIEETPNAAPVLANAIPDLAATEGEPFTFTLPENTFTDADSDALTYTITLEDGSALPAWLKFDTGSLTFSGTPETSDLGSIGITITVDDGKGATAEDSFEITVRVPMPLLSDFSPKRGWVGDKLTLTGEKLDLVTEISLNGTAADFTLVDANTLEVVVPDGTTTGSIILTYAGGQVESATNFTMDIVTSLRENRERSFSVYPNPGPGIFIVETNYHESQDISYQVYDLSGKTVAKGLVTGDITEIDLRNYPNGTYIIVILSDQGRSVTRVIKQ